MSKNPLEKDKNQGQEPPDFSDLSSKSVENILKIINREDQIVAPAVKQALGSISKAVKLFIKSWKRGGRVFFVGAGTSGRLGALEALELPPTFGIPEGRVQSLLAGGKKAMLCECEEAEDDWEAGRKLVQKEDMHSEDLVIGISASGETPFTLGCLEVAGSKKVGTTGIISNFGSTMGKIVDIPIVIEVGAEVLNGSTRMKAGTAQKLVLNMLTTTAMTKLGHVYGNLMIDVKASNRKLKKRAEQMLQNVSGKNSSEVEEVLRKAHYEAKPALLMMKRNCTYNEAKNLLESNDNRLEGL